MKESLDWFFTWESVQQIQIVDIRTQTDEMIIDCTMAVFLQDFKDLENGFLVNFNKNDLIRTLELKLDLEGDVQLTNLVHVNPSDKTTVPFAIIVTISSLLILGALFAFLKIGLARGMRKGELISGWFLSVFRPTILGRVYY